VLIGLALGEEDLSRPEVAAIAAAINKSYSFRTFRAETSCKGNKTAGGGRRA
jgi:hypothetical protein